MACKFESMALESDSEATMASDIGPALGHDSAAALALFGVTLTQSESVAALACECPLHLFEFRVCSENLAV